MEPVQENAVEAVEMEEEVETPRLAINDPAISQLCMAGNVSTPLTLLKDYLYMSYGVSIDTLKTDTIRKNQTEATTYLTFGNLTGVGVDPTTKLCKHKAAQDLLCKLNPALQYWDELTKLIENKDLSRTSYNYKKIDAKFLGEELAKLGSARRINAAPDQVFINISEKLKLKSWELFWYEYFLN